MKLNLGVIEAPYSYAASEKKPKRRRRGAGPRKAPAGNHQNQTTGDVAEILEDRYHVMAHFLELHGADIGKSLEEGLAGALESFFMGAPLKLDVFGAGTGKIEELFKTFLSQREMDSLGYPGIPTKAAQAGVSHRFKNPYKKRPPRPSFVDTGLYEAMFKSWME